jgi:glutamate 5-kinase
VIDSGAHHVLSRRESGGRLLPAGVLEVIGAFASGQAVRIVIHRRTDGKLSEDPESARISYLSGMATTRAGTPTLLAAASMSSSISSLDSLSRSGSSTELSENTQVTSRMLPEIDKVSAGDSGVDDSDTTWEEVEVGRGLANYNSAQISKLKGLNRYVHSL